MDRLELYDKWNEQNRLLVHFEDLLFNPERFVPTVMAFLGEDLDNTDFVNHYASFKAELREQYDANKQRTGSNEDTNYFCKEIPVEILRTVDDFVSRCYPQLWEKYLKQFRTEE
jgi:hypothetical protein